MRNQTKKTLQEITDCFTGADGGIQFAEFKGLVEMLDERAVKGDVAAQQCLAIMEKFNRMTAIPRRIMEESLKTGSRVKKKGPVTRTDEDPLGYPGDGVARFD